MANPIWIMDLSFIRWISIARPSQRIRKSGDSRLGTFACLEKMASPHDFCSYAPRLETFGSERQKATLD